MPIDATSIATANYIVPIKKKIKLKQGSAMPIDATSIATADYVVK